MLVDSEGENRKEVRMQEGVALTMMSEQNAWLSFVYGTNWRQVLIIHISIAERTISLSSLPTVAQTMQGGKDGEIK